jgi:hypothetical protein
MGRSLDQRDQSVRNDAVYGKAAIVMGRTAHRIGLKAAANCETVESPLDWIKGIRRQEPFCSPKKIVL